MLICKNDKKKKYKGTEPSPKGLGYCAHGEKEGKKRKGRDGNKWVIKKISNGSLRWVKVTKVKVTKVKVTKVKKIKKELTKDQKKTLLKIKKELKKELKKVGVKLFIVKNKIYNGIYFTDYPWDVVSNKLGDYSEKEKFLIVVLKINYDNEIILDKGFVNIQHHGITYNTKKEVIKLLKNIFGKKYRWSEQQKDTIQLKL